MSQDLPLIDSRAAWPAALRWGFETALQRGARAVYLSLIFPASDVVVAGQIDLLRRLAGPGLAILAGGAASASYDAALLQAGAFRTDTPEVFERALVEILN